MLNEARVDMAGWKWNELKDNPQIAIWVCLSNINHRSTTPIVFKRDERSGTGPQKFGPSIGSIFDQWTLQRQGCA